MDNILTMINCQEVIEVWKPIKDFEGMYDVSNLGRVKSLRRIIIKSNQRQFTVTEKILAERINSRGYSETKLSNSYSEIKSMYYKLHRLVATAFIQNPNELAEVNHKDGNKQNNKVDNLEWCSHQDNMIHSYKAGLNSRKGEKGTNKVTEEEVRYIRQKKEEKVKCGLVYEEFKEKITYGGFIQIWVKRSWKHIN